MQPERVNGRESGAQSWRGLLVRSLPKMNTVGLQQAEAELRKASQSLWEYRTKAGATVELATFLDSAQTALYDLLQHLQDCRQTLERTEPI